MKRDVLTTPSTFPAADATAMVRDAQAIVYHWGDVVGVVANGGRLGKAVSGPAPAGDDWKKTALRKVPVCDISPLSPRMPLADRERNLKRLPWLAVAFGLHLLVVGIFVLVSYLGLGGFSRLSDLDVVPVEVNFGVSDEFSAAAPTRNTHGETAADVEATKVKEALPQLPKTLAVDAAEKAPDTLPLPATPTPVATRKREAEATPEPGTKVMKAEEIAKRMEREQRKAADKEQAGTHRSPGAGVKDPLSDMPADPFASKGDASGAMQPGDIRGNPLAGPQSEWASAMSNHMKRNWNLPDVVNFDPTLRCQVRVDVNMFGKVLSVKVVKPSGNKDFDDEVVQAVERASPFPDFSSAGNITRPLVMDFRPSDVQTR